MTRTSGWACAIAGMVLAAAGCSCSETSSTRAPQEAPAFWTDDADARRSATDLLERMSLDEKINMMHGELNGSWGFHNAAIESLGIPPLNMEDGPVGVRVADTEVNGGLATQLPSGPALAATFDLDMALRYGELLGRENRAAGANVQLSPAADIIRISKWGRSFETFSEDPLLTGRMAAAATRGIQTSPVVAVVKHWIGYSQEAYRLGVAETNVLEAGRVFNIIADERTMREIYIRPFDIALREGRPGSVMCGFQQVAGTPGCEDAEFLGILKDELGFQGWVMSDYNSIYSTVPSVMAGADQEMPGNITPEVGPGDCFFCGPLLDAVRDGEVPESRIDDAVTRMLWPMHALGLFENPPEVGEIAEEENGAFAREVAEQAIVLLKNEGELLPLGDGVRSIAVIGSEADALVFGGGSSRISPTYAVSPLDGLRNRAGEAVTIEHLPGSDPMTGGVLLPGVDPIPSDFFTPPGGEGNGLRAQYYLNTDFSGEPELDRVEPYLALNTGFLVFPFHAKSVHFPELPQSLDSNISARWTGTLTAPVAGEYELILYSSGTGRLFVDDALVAEVEPAQGSIVTESATLTFEAGSEHAIRVEYAFDTERISTDTGPQVKLSWNPPEGIVAPQAEAAAELARNADVAIIFARDYASEGADKSTLALQFGQEDLIRLVADANPRTIVVLQTAAAVLTDPWEANVPAILEAWYGGQEQGNAIARVLYGDVNPSGKLPVTFPVDDASTPVSSEAQYPGIDGRTEYSEGIFVGYRGFDQFGIEPQYPFGYGLSYTTFEYADLRIAPSEAERSPFEVTVRVTNTGDRAGTEVVQVYVGRLPASVESAPRALAGFSRASLEPGASIDVTIPLDRDSFSYWDTEQDGWVTPTGDFPILVGSSSSDIRLEGTATRDGDAGATPYAP